MRLTGIFFQNEVGFIQSSFFVKAQSYQLSAISYQLLRKWIDFSFGITESGYATS